MPIPPHIPFLILEILILSLLVIIGFKDYIDRLIPHILSIPLLFCSLFFLSLFILAGKLSWTGVGNRAGIIVALLILHRMKAIGKGDLKVMFATTLVVPKPSFYAIVLALLVTLVIIKYKKNKEDKESKESENEEDICPPTLFFFSLFVLPFCVFSPLLPAFHHSIV